MGREFELKYRATPEQMLELRKTYQKGLSHRILMETTYYDTPEHSLSARKWTLRQRLENGHRICTLKTPLADGSRGEWEVEAATIEQGISELCKLNVPEELTALTAGGVVPVCGARFTRVAVPISMPGYTLELALDEGVLLGGGKEAPLCEVEVELKDGSEIAVIAFAKAVAAQYGLVPEHQSKFRRAMLLARSET